MAEKKQRTLWPRVPPGFVKGQLLAHKLLGLVLAAVMYLVCITGAIAVFYAEFERWEKPAVPEMSAAAPETIGRAIADARAHILAEGETPLDVFVTVPSPDMPRLVVGYDEQALAYDAEGAYAGSANHDLTHFLVEMHYALNLPWQIGFVIIGILGVLLTALIVGGALALPRMFRDAFTLRLDGGRRMSRVDLHNRLAVWGLPFHFIVAVSGAMMGVLLIMLTLAGPIQFGGDGTRAMAALYGDPAAFAAQPRRAEAPAPTEPEARIVAALRTMAREQPQHPPLYLALNQFNTEDEGLAIAGGHADRLIYAETYRFDRAGAIMGSDGYADGEAGRQVYASMFRVHAGAFGGPLVEWLYALLGLALCFICTTGVDIWLAKAADRGRFYPRIQSAWTSFVWATPALLALACTLSLLAGTPPVPVFWIGLVAFSLLGMLAPQTTLHWLSPMLAGVAVLSLPLAHTLLYGAAALSGVAAAVNVGFAGAALALLGLGLRNSRRRTARPALTVAGATG